MTMTNATPTTRRMKLGLAMDMDENGVTGQVTRFRDLQAQAQAAEQVGFDSLWIADHFIFRFPDRPEAGTWEMFAVISALAAVTARIQLGSFVACTAFRPPALTAKIADTIDEISGGRFILGLGAGWHEPEFTAFGYPFDHLAARFDEALQIIAPLIREGHVDFHGQYYAVTDSALRPRGPSAGRIPIWIGARRPRMLELTARYADGFNTVWHLDPANAKAKYDELAADCQKIGRDPGAIVKSAGTFVHILEGDEQPKPDENTIHGTAEEIAEKLRGFADAGTEHLVVVIEPAGLEGIGRFAKVIELLDKA